MKPIFFIGFMGVGKTTIGKHLGELLNLPVIDMDSYIENKEKKSINEIFNQQGEQHFRDLENKVLLELVNKQAIITTGGGVIEREENLEILRQQDFVVHLTCPFASLWSRLEGDENRPLVQNNSKKRLSSLYNLRFPLYESGSSITIHTDNKSIEEVIEEILPHLDGQAE